MAASCLLWLPAACRPGAVPAPSQPQLLYTLAGGGTPSESSAFSPRGDLLATGSEDGTIKLWDLSTGRLRRMLTGQGSAIGSVAFSPDGKRLAASRGNGRLELWDITSGLPSGALPGVYGAIAFSPDGRLLAAAGNNRVKLWDTRSWETVTTLPGARLPADSEGTSIGIGQLVFAPDGKSLAGAEKVFHQGEPGSPADFVQILDTASWKVRRSLPQRPFAQIQVAFSPDSQQLVIAAGWIYRGQVLLWNMDSGITRSLLSVDDEDTVTSIVYDPQGRWIAVDSSAGVRFLDVTSGKQFLVVKVGGAQFGSDQMIAASPDGRLLAAERDDGAVEVWRLPADLDRASAAAPAAAGSGITP